MTPVGGFVWVLDVDSASDQRVLVSQQPCVDVAERVVEVNRKSLFVGAVGSALGTGLRAESAIEGTADNTACFAIDWENNTGLLHLGS